MFNLAMAANENEWQARAALFELLALSFRHPTPELADVLYSGEWAEAAEELARANGIDLPGPWLAVGPSAKPDGAGFDDAESLLHALRAEATRLFVGAPTPAAPPYEGVWRAGDDGVQALLFVNPHSLEVEQFCRSCGLGHPEGTNEPLDHIATELELMEYLAAQAAEIVEPSANAPTPGDYPGGSPEAAFALFADEHLLTWASRFAQKVQAETRLPFYRAASVLLDAAMR